MKVPEGSRPREVRESESLGNAQVRTALPADAWLPVLQDALARQGRFTFPLRGDSMDPTLPPECDIEVLPLAGRLRLGQLIVFVAHDALVAHRLVWRSGEDLVAQGDNRLGPDGLVKPDQVVGRVTKASVRGHQVWPRRGETLWVGFWLARHQVLRIARWVWRRIPR